MSNWNVVALQQVEEVLLLDEIPMNEHLVLLAFDTNKLLLETVNEVGSVNQFYYMLQYHVFIALIGDTTCHVYALD
jgi:hypothetical protein